jgi:hypothetical protein
MPGSTIASALPTPEGRRGAASGSPIRIDRRADTLLGGLVLAIATIWIGAALSAFIAHPPGVLNGLGEVSAGPVLLVGAGFALWALDLVTRTQTLVSGNAEIEVTTRRLTGVRRWREPLANYHGLRHRRRPLRHRYGWRTEHRIELAHPDPTKAVVLLRTGNEARAEACWRDWARQFAVPSLPNETSVDRPHESTRQGPGGDPQPRASA